MNRRVDTPEQPKVKGVDYQAILVIFSILYMGVSWIGGTSKSSILDCFFPLETIYVGVPHLWKPPYLKQS